MQLLSPRSLLLCTFISILSCQLLVAHQNNGLYMDNFPTVNEDVFSAMISLEKLIPTQEELVTTLQSFIFTEEAKLKRLAHYVEGLRLQNEEARKDKMKFLANPINAYLLIKKLTFEWDQVKVLVMTNQAKDLLHVLSHLTFPTTDDFGGASAALARIQMTYQLHASSIARGELNGVKYSTELSSDDCFTIAITAYSIMNYDLAHQWLEESLNRFNMEPFSFVSKEQLLEYLSWTNYYRGNLEEAIKLIDRLIKINPSAKAYNAKRYYQNETELIKNRKSVEQLNYYNEEIKQSAFATLCRGEETIDEQIKAQLKCYYYQSEGNYFLTLAPFKVEEAYKSPLILVYYDVLSDREIEMVKRLAEPHLKRASVRSTNGTFMSVSNRIGKSAWLYEERYKEVIPINKRLEDMTGLTMDSGEALQVLNYGIGGHYTPHFDFFNGENSTAFINDRIATILIYLNDVAEGGSTVFPFIGVSVQPKKGAAVFWYNLLNNLKADYRSFHAACPVLIGFKWVTNKWIHEYGQEFRRPCLKEIGDTPTHDHLLRQVIY